MLRKRIHVLCLLMCVFFLTTCTYSSPQVGTWESVKQYAQKEADALDADLVLNRVSVTSEIDKPWKYIFLYHYSDGRVAEIKLSDTQNTQTPTIIPVSDSSKSLISDAQTRREWKDLVHSITVGPREAVAKSQEVLRQKSVTLKPGGDLPFDITLFIDPRFRTPLGFTAVWVVSYSIQSADGPLNIGVDPYTGKILYTTKGDFVFPTPTPP